MIRGNLLIIPIEDALFYLEAIYLQAKKPEGENGGDDKPRRPKLEMVVLKAGSNELEAVQAQTFDEALNMLLLGIPMNGETPTNGEKPSTLAELVQQYRERAADSDRILEQILEKMVE